MLAEESGWLSGQDSRPLGTSSKEREQSGAQLHASVSPSVLVGTSQSGPAVRRSECVLCPLPTGPAPEAVQKSSRAAGAVSSLQAVLAMQGPPAPAQAPAPGSPRDSPRGSPGLFRKLLVNQSIRLQRRFTVAHPLW